MVSLQEVETRLAGFKDLITIEQEHEHIIVRPRAFLGSENFQKIATLIKELNGEYISAGKLSHFRIAIGNPAPSNVKENLLRVIDELQGIVKQLP